MRIFFFLLFIVLSSKGLSQFIKPDSTYTEKYYFRNGNVRLIVDYCIIDNQVTLCGKYEEYDSLGSLLIKGQYAVAADSLECYNCFYLDYPDSTLHQYFKSGFREVRVGIWNYYYPNGQVKEFGEYSIRVHEEWSRCLFITNPDPGVHIQGPCPVGHHPEYLKNGYWNYFRENGQQVTRIYYYEGSIIETAYVPIQK